MKAYYILFINVHTFAFLRPSSIFPFRLHCTDQHYYDDDRNKICIKICMHIYPSWMRVITLNITKSSNMWCWFGDRWINDIHRKKFLGTLHFYHQPPLTISCLLFSISTTTRATFPEFWAFKIICVRGIWVMMMKRTLLTK